MEGVNPIIAQRKSCRSFLNHEVSINDIKLLLESARWAPSGKNGQPWRFIIVKEKETKKKIVNCSIYKEWMIDADTLIIVYLEKEKSYNYKKDIQAVGAAIENICLQATAMGIGSCWIGEILAKEVMVNQILEVPQTFELMAVICIGYEDKSVQRTERLELDEIIYKSM